MRDGTPSRTAAWVAMLRGVAPLLPREARLVDDPYGLRLSGGFLAAIEGAAVDAARRHPMAAPFLSSVAIGFDLSGVLGMQLRTRALDEALLDFVRASGRQVVLLGAGYDARALRFARELRGVSVFEVDHPATQARKKRRVAEVGTPPAELRYVAWDFERQPVGGLPDRLAELGHDRSVRTLTIWEGVATYLTEGAVDAAVRAVRALSAPGSTFALTYVERDALQRPRRGDRLWRRLIAAAGEPFRSGFTPSELPGWLRERGFSLQSDRTLHALGEAWLPRRYARSLSGMRGRHVAVARAV